MRAVTLNPAAAAGRDDTAAKITAQFIRLALPMIASNILQQLYNTIDTIVIGRYADRYSYAAAGVASSVMNLFLFAVVGML